MKLETINSDILENAQKLVAQLQNGNTEEAWQLISNLNKIREDAFFQEIGKLTRELHDALKNFHVDIDKHGVETKEFSDARERLNYVIEITEDAANKTMDGIEASIPHSQALAKEAANLFQEWGRFERREMTAAEFKELYQSMMSYLLSTQERSEKINKNLQEVLLAQEFQDLSGQIIKRVIKLVTDVENRLVTLIKVAAEAERYMMVKTDEKPKEEKDPMKAKIEAQGPTATACSQDEIDDILGSLGF